MCYALPHVRDKSNCIYTYKKWGFIDSKERKSSIVFSTAWHTIALSLSLSTCFPGSCFFLACFQFSFFHHARTYANSNSSSKSNFQPNEYDLFLLFSWLSQVLSFSFSFSLSLSFFLYYSSFFFLFPRWKLSELFAHCVLRYSASTARARERES